jgi:ribosome-interacting GTPase 1
LRDLFQVRACLGRSVRFGGQKVGLVHGLIDEAIITLIEQ